MQDPQFTLTLPATELPQSIATRQDLDAAAAAFAEASVLVRKIKELRLEKTRKLDEFKEDYMEVERKNSAEAVALMERVEPLLSEWRGRSEVGEKKAEIAMLRRKGVEAQKDGDAETVALIAEKMAALDEEVSVRTEQGTVGFRSHLTLTSVDESQLPERYWKRVVDEEQIKADVDLLGSVPGVEHEWAFKPYLIRK